ncbi:formin-like protein 3 X2, partial [Biomphalaria pfeifferi]
HTSYIPARDYDQLSSFPPIQSVETWKTFPHSVEQSSSQTSYDEPNHGNMS